MAVLAGALYGALLCGVLVLTLGTSPPALVVVALVLLGASVARGAGFAGGGEKQRNTMQILGWKRAHRISGTRPEHSHLLVIKAGKLGTACGLKDLKMEHDTRNKSLDRSLWCRRCSAVWLRERIGVA